MVKIRVLTAVNLNRSTFYLTSTKFHYKTDKTNITIFLLSWRNQILSVGFRSFGLFLLLSDYKQEVAG